MVSSSIPKTPEEKRQQSRADKSISQYQFPSDIGIHSLLLLFKKYSFRDNTTSTPEITTTDSIMLPLPDNLLENFSIRVGSTELGVIGNAAASSGKFIQELASGEGDSIKKLVDALRNGSTDENLSNIGNVALAAAIRSGLGNFPGLTQGASIGTGYTMNPYQALVFSGVDLRTFSFSWTFAPRTREETRMIKRILTKIKKAVLPEYAPFVGRSGTAFLSYPDVCHVKVNGSPDPIKFKPCMISMLQVDHAGTGEPVFLEGGDPAVYKVSLSLSEIEIWTKRDYSETNEALSTVWPGV